MIVLIALVSLSLAAVALIRSVDTASLIAGNLAFKQGTTVAADRAAEAAMEWVSTTMLASPADLYTDRCSSGCTVADTTTAFYATSLERLDISGHAAATDRIVVDWNEDGCGYANASSFAKCIKASPPVTAGGYVTSYVIARMCKTAGDPNATSNNCSKPTSGGAGGRKQINKGETKYGLITSLGGAGGSTSGASATPIVYRVIARSVGPRNSVSYTETYVSAVEL